jgi:hypothetical protein
MKRIIIAVMLAGALFALAGCSTAKPAATGGTGGTGSSETTHSTANQPHPNKFVNKTELFLHVVKVYDPAKFPKTAMTGEPSNIPFFKPEKDEGIVNRDYPTFDKKTFKFLSLPTTIIAPQDYYMFQKNGGTLNAALKGTGYKATSILDSGHIKILPNLYLGYYDFAWVPLNVLAEYWSGNESMSQELWRDGNDYVVIGASYDGGISLMAPQDVTDIKQLAGQKIGIMNPSFNIEALFNKKLESVGLATESAGGTVGVEMGMPGFVMNDLLDKKIKAVFAWSIYEFQLRKNQNYHEVVKWQDMGYGSKVPYVVLVVRKDILAKHPDIVQKVVQLNYDATKQALTVGDFKKTEFARIEHYWSYFMGVPKKVDELREPALVNLDAEASPVFMKGVYDYMIKCGYFKVPYKYRELVNHTLYEKIKK